MSIASARTALRTCAEACARSPLLPDRWVWHPGELEKAAGKSRLFLFSTLRWGIDSGLASATLVQHEAVWSFRGLYSAERTIDMERLERAMEQDLDLLASAFLRPAAWWPHLDACVPGEPSVETVPGQTEAVARIAVLPLTVLYRS